jgi:hypothetical protein
MQFITTTALQRDPKQIGDTFQIITSRGKPKAVGLPYFEGSTSFIEDYLEAYEIHMNRDILKKRMEESEASGISSFSI